MVRLLSVLLCFILPSCLWAQEAIQTQPHSGIEDLVKNLFIKGNCKNVSNITAIGNVEISIGQFSNDEIITPSSWTVYNFSQFWFQSTIIVNTLSDLK